MIELQNDMTNSELIGLFLAAVVLLLWQLIASVPVRSEQLLRGRCWNHPIHVQRALHAMRGTFGSTFR